MLTEDAKKKSLVVPEFDGIDTSEKGKGVEAVIDVKDLKASELRKLLRKKGLYKKGMRKPEMVEILKR